MSCLPSLLSISKTCDQNVGGIKSLQVLNFQALVPSYSAAGIYSNYDNSNSFSIYRVGTYTVDLVGKTLINFDTNSAYTLPSWVTNFNVIIVIANRTALPQTISVSLGSVNGLNDGLTRNFGVLLDTLIPVTTARTPVQLTVNEVSTTPIVKNSDGSIVYIKYDNTIDDWHSIEFYKNSGKFDITSTNDTTIGCESFTHTITVNTQINSSNNLAPYLVGQPDFLCKILDNNNQQWILGGMDGLVASATKSTGVNLKDASPITLKFMADQSVDAIPLI